MNLPPTPDPKPAPGRARRIALIVVGVAAFWGIAGYMLWDSALGVRVRAVFGIAAACETMLSAPGLALKPPFRVMSNPSASMEPTLPRGSTMTVAALPAGWIPKRGELIVFNRSADPTTTIYVKRVVGLPGDTLRFDGDDVYLNGTLVAATDAGPVKSLRASGQCREFTQRLDAMTFRILRCGTPIEPSRGWGDQVVPPNRLFVLGDNRDNSADSRFDAVGMVAVGDVTGLPHCLEKRK